MTVRSPSPVVPDPPVKLGWLTMGRIVRVMTFQSSVTWSGMTGWMLRTFCVPEFPGPYPRPMLSWKGMLIMSATGFCAALASFSVSSSFESASETSAANAAKASGRTRQVASARVS